MAIKSFHLWLENKEAQHMGIKDNIVQFLKDELHITNEEDILDMNTADIDSEVISKLSERGIITTSDESIIERIKDGITIQELINLLSGEKSQTLMPTPNKERIPDNNPATQQPFGMPMRPSPLI